MRDLRGSGWRYFVIDKEMSAFLPRIGVYFEPDEPSARVRTTPPPRGALTKYERLPWTQRIYESDNLVVYRLDFSKLDARAPTRPVGGGR
jgi:hypothetical protein